MRMDRTHRYASSRTSAGNGEEPRIVDPFHARPAGLGLTGEQPQRGEFGTGEFTGGACRPRGRHLPLPRRDRSAPSSLRRSDSAAGPVGASSGRRAAKTGLWKIKGDGRGSSDSSCGDAAGSCRPRPGACKLAGDGGGQTVGRGRRAQAAFASGHPAGRRRAPGSARGFPSLFPISGGGSAGG